MFVNFSAYFRVFVLRYIFLHLSVATILHDEQRRAKCDDNILSTTV